jgi:hypothetical protein
MLILRDPRKAKNIWRIVFHIRDDVRSTWSPPNY